MRKKHCNPVVGILRSVIRMIIIPALIVMFIMCFASSCTSCRPEYVNIPEENANTGKS